MSIFNSSIGFGAYGDLGMDLFSTGGSGCDMSRAETCGTVAADGSSTCYDERGCPIYKEGITSNQGQIKALSKNVTATGKQFLQDRILRAQDAGETLTLDIFGKKLSVGAMPIEKKLAIAGIALGALMLLISAMKS